MDAQLIHLSFSAASRRQASAGRRCTQADKEFIKWRAVVLKGDLSAIDAAWKKLDDLIGQRL